MANEAHLFIIWSNALNKKDEIIEDIESRFTLVGMHKVSWEKRSFSSNLTRFYGENLPPHSNKEKLCGTDDFVLLVVIDNHPLYRKRLTSKGVQIVNVNMFDAKEMYRNWTGGGHRIHGTNSNEEFKHDIILLTGMSKEDYMKKYYSKQELLKDDFKYMPGENGWKNIGQILYVLNETTNYVVLRNFDGLFSDYNKSIHGDIDLLTSNRDFLRLILNAKPVHISKRRVQHIVKIGQGGTYVDIRYIGDNYYCKAWEESILRNRIRTEDNYFKPIDEDFIYALLYHALIQKKKVSEDYRTIFRQYFEGIDVTDDTLLFGILTNFLNSKKYATIEPYDYSVYFNKLYTKEGKSLVKIICKVVQHSKILSYVFFTLLNSLSSINKESIRSIRHYPAISKSWLAFKTLKNYVHKGKTATKAMFSFIIWNLVEKSKLYGELTNNCEVTNIKPYKVLYWKNSVSYLLGTKGGKDVFVKTTGNLKTTTREKNAIEYAIQNSQILKKHLPELYDSSDEMLIEETIHGKSLNSTRNYNTENTSSIIYQLYEIYKELKRLEIRHLDIRPDNFILDEKTGQIYLIDFGYSIIKSNNVFEGIPQNQLTYKIISKLGSRFSAYDGWGDDAYSMLMTMKYICPSLMHDYPEIWLNLNNDIGLNAIRLFVKD